MPLSVASTGGASGDLKIIALVTGLQQEIHNACSDVSGTAQQGSALLVEGMDSQTTCRSWRQDTQHPALAEAHQTLLYPPPSHQTRFGEEPRDSHGPHFTSSLIPA